MPAKANSTPVHLDDDIVRAFLQRRKKEGHIESKTAAIETVLNQYARGLLRAKPPDESLPIDRSTTAKPGQSQDATLDKKKSAHRQTSTSGVRAGHHPHEVFRGQYEGMGRDWNKGELK